MKAVLVNDSDKSLSWSEIDTPQPGEQDLLIKVHASAINRADLMQRKGLYPPPPGASPVMGLECAGEVVAVGGGCHRYQPGDKVCALLAGGGYAEYATVHEGSALPLPEGLGYVEAAALPEVFATAWLNLFMEASLQPGEKVILHAGASGVGTAGIQLCRAFDSPVFVTVGSEDKLSACLELGAQGGSNRHDGPFLDATKVFAGESGVDVILDPVGGAYLADNLTLLGLGGRLVLIGLMGGAASEINLAQLMIKRARVIGSTLRARSVDEKAEVMAQLEDKVWPLLASKNIKPIVDQVFPIEEIEAAHKLVESDKTIGKVILKVD